MSIPRERLLAALAHPSNTGAAQDALRRALGLQGEKRTRKPSNAAQRAAVEPGGHWTEDGGLLVTLPLPPKELSPNARVHWAKKQKVVREYRALADNAAFCASIAAAVYVPKWERATVQATFYFRDRRRRDTDNLLAMLKPAFDGLADAGVVANDSGFTHLPVRVEIDRERARVELSVHGH